MRQTCLAHPIAQSFDHLIERKLEVARACSWPNASFFLFLGLVLHLMVYTLPYHGLVRHEENSGKEMGLHSYERFGRGLVNGRDFGLFVGRVE